MFHMDSSTGVNFYRNETGKVHIHRDPLFSTCLHAMRYKIWGLYSNEGADVGILGCNTMWNCRQTLFLMSCGDTAQKINKHKHHNVMFVCGKCHKLWSYQLFWSLPTQHDTEIHFWDAVTCKAVSITPSDRMIMRTVANRIYSLTWATLLLHGINVVTWLLHAEMKWSHEAC
jgi:hypothetical protein